MEKYCQSCAMPMSEELFGSNADGSSNGEYCKYCFENGKFTNDVTMEQMIEICVPFMTQGEGAMDEKSARTMMQETFPHLKRWK